MRAAILGMSSEISTPGTLVLMARKRPAGGPAWFGVERFELARATGQPQQDHAFVLLLELIGQERLLEHVEHATCCGSRGGAPPRRRFS